MIVSDTTLDKYLSYKAFPYNLHKAYTNIVEDENKKDNSNRYKVVLLEKKTISFFDIKE